jgi:hypothetical protein
MPKIKTSQILKKDQKIESKKLTTDNAQKFITDVIAKQDFVLSLKCLDEKSLRAVVRL